MTDRTPTTEAGRVHQRWCGAMVGGCDCGVERRLLDEARAPLDSNILATAMAGVPLSWLQWVKDGPGDYPERYREAMQNAAKLIADEYERVAALSREDQP